MKCSANIAILCCLPAFLGVSCSNGGAVPQKPHAGIITMAPHLTETVFALGQGKRVIAVGTFDDYPPEVKTLPKAGGYLDPDLEKIAVLNPELIILPGKDRQVTDFAAMKQIPVLNVDMDSLETIDDGIAAIGKALGCETESDALRARVKSALDAIRAAVSKLPRPKVLILTMRQDHNLHHLYTANRNSFLSQLIECAGGDNIFADAPNTYPEASKETVVVRAPDAVVELHAGENLNDDEKARYIEDWKQLPTLPAVANKRIYLITESYAARPGPRVTEVARIVAKFLHPEAQLPEGGAK
jgi:iron complex transport system substrate-binding protein